LNFFSITHFAVCGKDILSKKYSLFSGNNSSITMQSILILLMQFITSAKIVFSIAEGKIYKTAY